MSRRAKQQQNPRRLPSKPDSIEDLRKKLEMEKELIKMHQKSVDTWASIVDDLNADLSQVNDDSEWKTRYYFHTLYNDMLRKQMKGMKMETRASKSGRFLFPSSIDPESMSVADWRTHVKNLETELTSVSSMCKSYERQLDTESTGYHRAREECDKIYNDVWFQQKARIQEQEARDKMIKTNIKRKSTPFNPDIKHKAPVVLPPISKRKSTGTQKSYAKMYGPSKPKRAQKHVQFRNDVVDLYEYSPIELT